MDKKTLSAIGALLGFIVILLFALQNASGMFGFTFEGMEDILGYFNLVKIYLVYALAGIAGLEFVADKKPLNLIFLIILAFVVISTFFPGVIESYIPA